MTTSLMNGNIRRLQNKSLNTDGLILGFVVQRTRKGENIITNCWKRIEFPGIFNFFPNGGLNQE